MNRSVIAWIKTGLLIAVVAVSSQVTTAGQQQPLTGEKIRGQAFVPAGTTNASSASYRMSSSIGEALASNSSSASYRLSQGFQFAANQGGVSFVCGDADGSGIVNISDVVFLIAYIFNGSPAPNPPQAGDADCSLVVNISDVVYLIAYVFSGGPFCAACK